MTTDPDQEFYNLGDVGSLFDEDLHLIPTEEQA